MAVLGSGEPLDDAPPGPTTPGPLTLFDLPPSDDAAGSSDALTDPRAVDPPALLDLDDASVAWLVALSTPGAVREQALTDLHALLVRAGRSEAHRRARRWCVTGQELDDVVHQAAADALVAITAKLGRFEGRSRFTTWVQKFVMLEVASKLGRHWWVGADAHLDDEDWERLPGRLGADPEHAVAWRGLVAAVHEAVDTVLTPHQREVFVAVVLDGVPLDAVCALRSCSRGAVYKTVFDARQKLRAHLEARGLLDAPPSVGGGQHGGAS